MQRLSTLGIERSMSRASNPWDNAAMESFFSTLQFELLSRKRFETRLVRNVREALRALAAADGKELWSVEDLVPRLTLRGTSPPVLAGEIVVLSPGAPGEVRARAARLDA